MNWNVVLSAVVASVVSALIVDLDAFLKARSTNPTANYDWVLAATRAGKGALTGVLAGLGLGAATA